MKIMLIFVCNKIIFRRNSLVHSDIFFYETVNLIYYFLSFRFLLGLL